MRYKINANHCSDFHAPKILTELLRDYSGAAPCVALAPIWSDVIFLQTCGELPGTAVNWPQHLLATSSTCKTNPELRTQVSEELHKNHTSAAYPWKAGILGSPKIKAPAEQRWRKSRLFSCLKLQTVAHIVRLIASAASISWFIFHGGGKNLMLFAVTSLMPQMGRWASNSYPLFHNLSPYLWAIQLTHPALFVFSWRFSRDHLVWGKFPSSLWNPSLGKRTANALGRDCGPLCLQGCDINPGFHRAFRCLCKATESSQ